MIFTAEQRDAVWARLLQLAREDPAVVAAAAIGSLTAGGDRWSDLDLTFGVDGEPLPQVIERWTGLMAAEFGAVHLFDLASAGFQYRVFLVPGSLQVDLSFAPAAEFGALGPRFHLLFGTAVQRTPPPGLPARQRFGLAVHHAVRARIAVQRGRLWQAEHWVTSTRQEVISLACSRLGLPPLHGRGADSLPGELSSRLEPALVRSLEPDELRRALTVVVEALLAEGEALPEAGDLAAAVAADLRELMGELPGLGVP